MEDEDVREGEPEEDEVVRVGQREHAEAETPAEQRVEEMRGGRVEGINGEEEIGEGVGDEEMPHPEEVEECGEVPAKRPRVEAEPQPQGEVR